MESCSQAVKISSCDTYIIKFINIIVPLQNIFNKFYINFFGFLFEHFHFSLFFYFLVQFQLVADLFHDGKGAGPPSATSKTSKINVRPAKPIPKGHNREHRKTVGTQVRLVSDRYLGWTVDPLTLCFFY